MGILTQSALFRMDAAPSRTTMVRPAVRTKSMPCRNGSLLHSSNSNEHTPRARPQRRSAHRSLTRHSYCVTAPHTAHGAAPGGMYGYTRRRTSHKFYVAGFRDFLFNSTPQVPCQHKGVSNRPLQQAVEPAPQQVTSKMSKRTSAEAASWNATIRVN